jgi:predicted DNA-binding transcriptional regulator AlpA
MYPTSSAARAITRTAHLGELKRMGNPRQHLTIAALCEELEVSRTTFYAWRVKGRAPRCIKLPNGEIRIRRTDLESWLTTCEEEAA